MSSNANNGLKQQPDEGPYPGSSHGVRSTTNLHKQMFYELLVKKGLVYMYNNGYDVDPDSPIFISERVLQAKCKNNDCEDGLKQVWYTILEMSSIASLVFDLGLDLVYE